MAGFAQIKIFCDTNVLHASQAHLLLSSKVSEYISEHSRIESVELKWLLPEMVIAERRHQMLEAAQSLSPRINELEKLLGHALGINDEVMADRIESKINRTLSDLGIEVCTLDSGAVNWDELIDRSAKRKAPFEITGEKEKGFRDALIAESFLQELHRSPSTPRSCLLVFITGDKRLTEYIQEKTESSKNVRLLETLDDLRSLLNAIASEITEEFLATLTPEAKKIFWDFEKEDGLYKKDDVYNKIIDKFNSEIKSVLDKYPGCNRNTDGVELGEQTFIRKTGQTVFWSRVVRIKFKITRRAGLKAGATATMADIAGLFAASSQNENVVATGKSIFSVEWQHQITTTGKISKPKVNNINFITNEIANDDLV